MASDTLVPYSDALKLVADSLVDRKTIHVGGFWDFIRDIWSKSYERPELFNAWHVGYICERLEFALSEKKWFCCVLPRYHLKSTVLGHGFSIWMFLKHANSRFASTGLYLSFSDGMSEYHMQEINRHVRVNEQLVEWMKDLSPTAERAFNYYIGNNRSEIYHGGVFSFKRGLHTNRFLIADDILKDPENPLASLQQLDKVEEHFEKESLYIPTGDAPVVVLGTPMAPNDIFTKLKDDERFVYEFLPALNPKPGYTVLCPEIRTETALLLEQKMHPTSFASEMMLQPYFSTIAYINDGEIRKVENLALKSLDPYVKHDIDSDYTVAGFDIGKKRHPSHLVIYTSKEHKLTQVCQYWLDGWDYTKQTKFLNDVAKNFSVDRGYIDNTRGELEDRGLATVWRPLTFTVKAKRTMAQIFEQFVMGQTLEMIADERQRSQITCVDQELNAAATPLGHGDSFFSNCLACLAFHEHDRRGVMTIGNMQDMMGSSILPRPKLFGVEELQPQGTCPSCGETSGWVEERKLCLICQYRGKNE